MSDTSPMAMEQSAGSSWLFRALYRNGENASMYFWKSSSSAVAIEPMAAKTVSGTLDLGGRDDRRLSSACMIRSDWGLMSLSNRWMMAMMTELKMARMMQKLEKMLDD